MSRREARRAGREIGRVSLVELAIRRAGWRRGIDAVMFVVLWGVAAPQLRGQPQSVENPDGWRVDEVAEWWGMSRAQVFRYQAMFRMAFPEHRTPAPIIEHEWNQEFRSKLFDAGQELSKIDAALRRDHREQASTELGFSVVTL